MTEGGGPGSTRHQCPGNGCQVMVPRNQLACRRHWFKVSRKTRDRVWQAFWSHDTDAHRAAMVDAVTEMNREAR